MKTFKDNEGMEWRVSINTTTVKRVRDLLQVDLMSFVTDKDLIANLVNNPILLVDIIYVLCKTQADERKITDEKFGEAMAGDAIALATEAMLDELVNFSPNAAKRKALQTAFARMKELDSIATAKVQKALDDPNFIANIERQMSGD